MFRYEVNVTACTILGDGHMGCSSHAATMGFITTIGPPARPPPPKPKFTNSTFVVIDWNKDFQVSYIFVLFQKYKHKNVL